MKLKTLFYIALTSVATLGVTSCADMLQVDSKTVMYDYQNTLDDATDSVYSVLGILSKMQKIADRTVILGEIRGDLVTVSDHASDDLTELYSYDFANVKSTNKYDQPVDYYAIINNCNFFLNKADTTLVRNQVQVLKGEYIVVLCYRAWAYLQLAQIYGEVPYFTDQATTDNKMNIKDLAQLLLLDFKDEYIEYMDKYSPNYGNLGGETLDDGSKTSQHKSTELFVPIRLIMGDLCLWAEDYAHAALYYHDFLLKDSHTTTTGLNCITWRTNDFLYTGSDNYTSNIFGSNGVLAYIPMEADRYSGTVSELPKVFNSISLETNINYNANYFQLTRSRAATAISVRQNYCYHAKRSASNRYEWAAYITDKSAIEEVLERGDLRLGSVLETTFRKVADDEITTSTLGTEIQTLNKIDPEKVWLYRKDVVYLRLAEALNRCELPQTAFAILKEGLCKATIDSLSQVEKDRAANVNGVDMSAVYDFPSTTFQPAVLTWNTQTVQTGGSALSYYCAEWSTGNTMGIHSRGCGDAQYDPNYTIPVDTLNGRIPTLQDSIRAVEEALIDEMALETCFEGYRFGDLMRIAMHRAQDTDSPAYGGFAENDFLAKRVATRETASMDDSEDYYQDMDNALYTKLLGDGKSFNKNWFLVLPDDKNN